jgi:NTE family protein
MADYQKPLAVVLSGGGARAAYQVGFLRCLAKHFPDLEISILTGVSAGAINAAFLANHQGTFFEAVEELSDLWRNLTIDQVFCVNAWGLFKNVFRWGVRLISGGIPKASIARSLLDPSPLRDLLNKRLSPQKNVVTGISKKILDGQLKAFAITGTNYSTGQAMTWTQGQDIKTWNRPSRRSVIREISIDHIMASAALPLIFPAVNLENDWYGDGDIRQSTPLSPAIYLGAKRILAISTRYGRSVQEANVPVCRGYPPPAQIAGVLLNSIFLDALDEDIRSLERTNRLLKQTPKELQEDFHIVDLFAMRPTQDLGKLAGQFEKDLPFAFRYLSRGLGSHETDSPDWLSMVMFDPHYLSHLIDLGQSDAENRAKDIMELMNK